MDTHVKRILRQSYNQQAQFRDKNEVQVWKVAEMDRVIAMLHAGDSRGDKRVLDLGSGPGHQASYLQNNGCEVVCVESF